MITFTVPGTPVAKGRPIASTFGGRVRMRTPARTERYEAQVAVFANQAMAGRAPIDDPVSVTVTAIMPIAASWSKKKRADALAGLLRPVGRPDLDNIAKSVGDGCNGIVWTDDSRIVDLRVVKRYGEHPALEVRVEAACLAAAMVAAVNEATRIWFDKPTEAAA